MLPLLSDLDQAGVEKQALERLSILTKVLFGKPNCGADLDFAQKCEVKTYSQH